MTIMKVYRDASGIVINIGEWDLMAETLEDGEQVIHNPVPDGATYTDEPVSQRADGGLEVTAS